MKIGVITASSQSNKSKMLCDLIVDVVDTEHQVINFSESLDNMNELSYVETAICICLLLDSKAIDFIVTGCTSGQGMMLACNSLPGILCGFIKDQVDAYLFGRINNGNVISLVLGQSYELGNDIYYRDIFEKLFSEPFGCGYPKKDAARKVKNANEVHRINRLAKKDILDVLSNIDSYLIQQVKGNSVVMNYIKNNSSNIEFVNRLKELNVIE